MSDHHRAGTEPSETPCNRCGIWLDRGMPPDSRCPECEGTGRSVHPQPDQNPWVALAAAEARVAALTAELAAGRERVRVLEEGLRPMADWWNCEMSGTGVPWEHCRRAAALLRPGACGEGA